MSVSSDLRLIEDYLPIEAISAEASREKSVRKGHISTLHLWWARRPLVACRAAVYGALVPADRWVKDVNLENPPDDAEKATKTKNGKKKGLNRKAAKEFVERLCKYPGEPKVIAEAQKHILEAHAERLTQELVEAKKTRKIPAWIEEFKFNGDKVTYDEIVAGRAPRPRVLDMFAGGGAIPLEALRLGCEAYAIDLNPVAHIIQLCTLVYPQKYGKPDPTACGMTGPKNAKGDTTWGGLPEEVRYWGNWVLERVRKEIGMLYPLVPDPEYKKGNAIPPATKAKKKKRPLIEGDDESEVQMADTPPGYLMPVAYLWTRTVRCKNPSCAATVPLLKQTWLRNWDGSQRVRVLPDSETRQVKFQVIEKAKEQDFDFDPSAFSKGGNATCPFCGTVADTDYVKAEGIADRIGRQPMTTVAVRKGTTGKIYLSPENASCSHPDDSSISKRLSTYLAALKCDAPNEPITDDSKNSFWIRLYGFKTFADIFLPRQMLSMIALASAIRAAEQEMLSQSSEVRHALITMLALVLDRMADFSSTVCVWNCLGWGESTAHTFGRQGLPMSWDFSEINPFSPETAGWAVGLDRVVAALESMPFGVPAVVMTYSAA